MFKKNRVKRKIELEILFCSIQKTIQLESSYFESYEHYKKLNIQYIVGFSKVNTIYIIQCTVKHAKGMEITVTQTLKYVGTE